MTARSRTRLTLGIAVLVIAVAAMVTGLIAAGTAIGIHAVVGQTGVLAENLGVIDAPAPNSAVVVDGVEASVTAQGLPKTVEDLLLAAGADIDGLIRSSGTFVLLATPTQEGDAFLGIADPTLVTAYVANAPHAVAQRDASGTWRTIGVSGDATLAPPAGAVPWIASSAGRPAQVDADGLSGRSLVVMRPDAAPGVSAELRLEYRVADAPRALRTSAVTAAAGCLGGLALALLGAWLVVGPRRQGRHA